METAPVAEIKPNIKEAFVLETVKVSIVLVLIIGSLLYLNNLVGLDIFIDTLRDFGVEISSSLLLTWFIIIVVVGTALLLIVTYSNLGKITYTLYPDKLVFNKSFLIMQVNEKVIPFSNIVKVSYGEKKTFEPPKITLDLTGIKGLAKLEMSFIDNPEQVVVYIQQLIEKYKADYYAKYSQNYRMQNIMEEL